MWDEPDCRWSYFAVDFGRADFAQRAGRADFFDCRTGNFLFVP
jgi:hypothetical protein